MKYIVVFLSLIMLTSCGTTTMSDNERFYEEVYKPRYKRLVVTPEEPKEEQVEQAEVEPEPEPKKEVIRIHYLNPVYQALQYLDYTEKENRSELKSLTGVDPVRIEWCAAFANAILEQSGISSNNDHENPLLARSFLTWGEAVEDPQMGDLVVFPRGTEGWQGHVGFYVKQQVIDDVLYYYILGGNQKNSVRVDLYRADRAIGIRRSN